MRPGSQFNLVDIQNEIRAIQKVCSEQGTHQNIVKVLKHGNIRSGEYIYIDMELCAINLENYIPILWKPSKEERAKMRQTGVTRIYALDLRMRYVWVVMMQIANGITFIHRQSEVHRDLKPQNGVPSKDIVNVKYCIHVNNIF